MTQTPRRRYFYPRPPRGGRQVRLIDGNALEQISIHALREEGDQGANRRWYYYGISIHALREEGDSLHISFPSFVKNFYPRPPRGGRLQLKSDWHDAFVFLSTPSARRATKSINTVVNAIKFLSTPSARRATMHSSIYGSVTERFLSTPSARRATIQRFQEYTWMDYFYPRPPRGGRPSLFIASLT